MMTRFWTTVAAIGLSACTMGYARRTRRPPPAQVAPDVLAAMPEVREKGIYAMERGMDFYDSFLEAEPVSEKWYLLRNQLTGLVTKRRMAARLYFTSKQGYCMSRRMSFTQILAPDGAWAQVEIDDWGHIEYVDCALFNRDQPELPTGYKWRD